MFVLSWSANKLTGQVQSELQSPKTIKDFSAHSMFGARLDISRLELSSNLIFYLKQKNKCQQRWTLSWYVPWCTRSKADYSAHRNLNKKKKKKKKERGAEYLFRHSRSRETHFGGNWLVSFQETKQCRHADPFVEALRTSRYVLSEQELMVWSHRRWAGKKKQRYCRLKCRFHHCIIEVYSVLLSFERSHIVKQVR